MFIFKGLPIDMSRKIDRWVKLMNDEEKQRYIVYCRKYSNLRDLDRYVGTIRSTLDHYDTSLSQHVLNGYKQIFQLMAFTHDDGYYIAIPRKLPDEFAARLSKYVNVGPSILEGPSV